MPDWARDDQFQLPDAPETPAPLFAYRALKGILFGSPEYDEEEQNNKENVAPIAPIPVSFNAKRKLENAAQEATSNEQSFDTRPLSSRIRDLAPPATSPRKRMLSSPGKSILRTPGLPTPRRQKVNVTFKNVRESISPIAQVTAAAKSKSKASSPLKRAEAAKNNRDKHMPKAEKELEAVSTPVYDMTSVESYLQSTEREMKRLVRYSQKMREYARRSDQENTALKRERDRLKQEVELLKASNGKKMASKKPTDRIKSSAEARDNTQAGKARNRAMAQVKSTTGKHESPGQEAARKARLVSIGRNAIKEPTGIDWIDLTKPDEDLPVAKVNRNDGSKGHDQDAVSTATARVPRSTSAPTKAQLAPDRLAAAKERLRIKNEQRRRVLSS